VIPDAIPSEVAGPLLCAGITTFAPLSRYAKAGDKVGVIGIGGLGHMALQYARCGLTPTTSMRICHCQPDVLAVTPAARWAARCGRSRRQRAKRKRHASAYKMHQLIPPRMQPQRRLSKNCPASQSQHNFWRRFGASHYLISSDKAAMAAQKRTFDFILCTAAANFDVGE
jgi:hypothetical protein